MRRILDHTMREESYEDSEQGIIKKQVLDSVSWLDAAGALHELKFHPVGANVAGAAEEDPRVVGDAVRHFTFTDPVEAVDAYENGQVV